MVIRLLVEKFVAFALLSLETTMTEPTYSDGGTGGSPVEWAVKILRPSQPCDTIKM